MKRVFSRILLVVLMMMVCLSGVSALAEAEAETEATSSPDFKSFFWGDSKSTVIATEGEPINTGKVNGVNADYIVYEASVAGMDMYLAYYFCDQGLYSIRYVSLEEHSNESLYIDDYNRFKNALTKKYGKPIWDKENWENDSKKNYYASKKGDALCYGYLTYSTWYLTKTTSIDMSMSADNYEIHMIVDYDSILISPGEADFSDVL